MKVPFRSFLSWDRGRMLLFYEILDSWDICVRVRRQRHLVLFKRLSMAAHLCIWGGILFYGVHWAHWEVTLGSACLGVANRFLTFSTPEKCSQLHVLSLQTTHLLHNTVESLINDSVIARGRNFTFKNLMSFLGTFVFLENPDFFSGRNLFLALISIETLTLDLQGHIW